MSNYAILLAGGSGTRLWPLSRRLLPKHLLALSGGPTLLQETASRLISRLDPARILTVTHVDHQSEARRQLGAVHPALTERILAEPRACNTLPAVAWGVAEVAKEDPQDLIAVFPSDHAVRDLPAFHEALERAFAKAQEGYLVTLGIRPTGPETGYGYIVVHGVAGADGDAVRFVEKPDRPKAMELIAKGNCYWNAGIFVFSASTFQEEIKAFEPEIWEKARLGDYTGMKSISIDYGIMERSKKVAVVPADFGWSDLGSWEAVYEFRPKDAQANVLEGDVLALDTRSSLLLSKKGFLTTIGIEDAVVIQTEDAVLVSARDRVQDVKKVVEALQGRRKDLVESPPTVHRPWGSFTVLEEGPGYKIKRIVVEPGQKLSLQRHAHRSEHWVVIEGTAKVTNESHEIVLRESESTFIPVGHRHRLENPGSEPLMIIEVQTGSYVGEDDIERFDDVYGRATRTTG